MSLWCYCLILSFYIKPQPIYDNGIVEGIVLYCLSTSNHNRCVSLIANDIIVLYCLSTSNHNCLRTSGCSRSIVLYCLSTSNHNTLGNVGKDEVLSYIVFLHQTTTRRSHKTRLLNCLILSFYIKPQLAGAGVSGSWIVLYCLSTSNHNRSPTYLPMPQIVLYCLSTSNHNSQEQIAELLNIVLYCLSTSNHNLSWRWQKVIPIVLYCLSTSNHNKHHFWHHLQQLSYIVFLHQTTTAFVSYRSR